MRVRACGVCRTDLHIVDGELTRAEAAAHPRATRSSARWSRLGDGVEGVESGERVGIPWLGWTCGECRYCRSGRENLCDRARFTGYHVDGGYAEDAVRRRALLLPASGRLPGAQAAPLLCGGLIGYRALRSPATPSGSACTASAPPRTRSPRWPGTQGRRVFAFTRAGDVEGQEFARELGAEWAGASDDAPPELLDAALIFAPVGDLVPVGPAGARRRAAWSSARAST